jgi:hypothetical protein
VLLLVMIAIGMSFVCGCESHFVSLCGCWRVWFIVFVRRLKSIKIVVVLTLVCRGA